MTNYFSTTNTVLKR